MSRRVAAGLVALVLATGATGAACADHPAAGERPAVTVLAAASLTETFTRIAAEFERATGTRVVLSFGASSTLARQITAGAPADVFASASPAVMAQVTDAVGPAVFARNQLVIAVPRGNPDRIAALADLAAPGRKVALCAEQVPCGGAARTALDAGAVRLTPVTLEQDVKATLTKLRLGEVDAALVYRTDVRAAADVDAVEFAESARAVNDYPIAALPRGPNPDGGRAFVAHVRSAPALAVLATAGFQPP